MPNWVYTNMTVTGDAQALARFRDTLKSEDNPFDFNRMIPMPEALLIDESSFGSIGYDAIYGNPAAVLHYAWVLEAGVTNVEQLRAYLDEQDPRYRELAQRYHQNLQQYGAKTWYDWSNQHWGTKWNACEALCNEFSDYLEYSFNTAWGFPTPVIEALIAQYPELTFKGTAEEESDAFYFEFTSENGELNIEEMDNPNRVDDDEDDEEDDE